MDKLKPCPFCEGQAGIHEDHDSWTHFPYKVYCKGCGKEQEDYYRTEESAIKVWNERPKSA